ncbi:MAG: tryptophan synthase subunit alpha [Spirochaetes bacterium]|nr:tryptophan synthase subunit alpha [Spirochaetota bacterium]MBU0956037.1 tryptophan synthase subunit alpha [Spirochaetota bacterium]
MNDLFLDKLQAARLKERPLLMTHFVAGYPAMAESRVLAEALAAAGADILECQLPFSDPLADGPSIMQANQQALDNGSTPKSGFALLDGLSARTGCPLIIMSYVNIAYRMGWEKFALACKKAGAYGLLMPDLPLDEGGAEFQDLLAAQGVHLLPVVSPGMEDERLALVLRKARGFIYATLRSGVTGARSGLESSSLDFLRRIHQHSTLPVAAGFGISDKVQIDSLQGLADIVVIGSHLLDLYRTSGLTAVQRFVRSLQS